MGKKHKKHKSERRNDDDEEKPHLKIVLKLGGEGVYDSDYAASSPASYGGEYTIENEKPHKKKKKKHRHHSDEHEHRTLKIKKRFRKEYEAEMASAEADDVEADAPAEKPSVSSPQSPEETSQSSLNTSTFSPVVEPPKSVEPPPKKRREAKPVPMSALMRTSLDKLLEHLLRQLERKDPHEIFAWPVNDMIAPGYSDFIKEPMDFSTMRKKISQHKYSNINEFKDDFKLMINNCCTYNRPETIFYESAKKLLSAGIKIMSKERLVNMKRTLGFLHDLNKSECAQIMGLPLPEEDIDDATDVAPGDIDVTMEEEKSSEAKEETSAEETNFDLRAHPDAVSFTDADNEETVAPDVIQAAKQAKEKLASKCPKSKMGFLRIDNVGKTTFNFLNPDPPEEASQIVDLGTLTGRLVTGIDALPEAKEDKRNRVTPLSYLGYGPFSSFAPTYDSRVANITQEESDLLLAAYGGETEYLFAKSMHNFVKDSGSDLVTMVDDLLDTLTHGAHKRALESVEERRKKDEEKEAKTKKEVEVKVEPMEQGDASGSNNVQDMLDRAGELVVKLEKTQNERLSEKPPHGMSNLKEPSEEETAIATSLQNQLSNLIRQAKPEDVSSVTGVRKAIGIDLNAG